MTMTCASARHTRTAARMATSPSPASVTNFFKLRLVTLVAVGGTPPGKRHPLAVVCVGREAPGRRKGGTAGCMAGDGGRSITMLPHFPMSWIHNPFILM